MKKLTILITALFIIQQIHASTVNSFTGTCRNGQVFFTWNNVNNNGPVYKLYRSTTPSEAGFS